MLSGDPANKPLNRLKKEGNEGLEEGRETDGKRGEKQKGREKDIVRRRERQEV